MKDINYVDSLPKSGTKCAADANGLVSVGSSSVIRVSPTSSSNLIHIKDANKLTHVFCEGNNAIKLVLENCPNVEYVELPGANTSANVENELTILEKGKVSLQSSLLINGTMKEVFALWGTDENDPCVILERYDAANAKGLTSLLDCGFIGTSWDIQLGENALNVDLLVIQNKSARSNPLKGRSNYTARYSAESDEKILEIDAQVVSLSNFSKLEVVVPSERVRCLYLEDCANLQKVVPQATASRGEINETNFGKQTQVRVNAARKKVADAGASGTSLSVLDIVRCKNFNYYLGSTEYLGLTGVVGDAVQTTGKVTTLWSDSNRIRTLACQSPERMYFAGKGVGQDGAYCSIQNIYATGATPSNTVIYADDDNAALPILDGSCFDPTSKSNDNIAWAPASSKVALDIEWGYILENNDNLRANGFKNWSKVQTEDSDIVTSIAGMSEGAKKAAKLKMQKAFPISLAWDAISVNITTAQKGKTGQAGESLYVPAKYPKITASDKGDDLVAKESAIQQHHDAWQGAMWVIIRTLRDTTNKAEKAMILDMLSQSFAPVQLYYMASAVWSANLDSRPDTAKEISDCMIRSIEHMVSKMTSDGKAFVSQWDQKPGYAPHTTSIKTSEPKTRTALDFMFAKSEDGEIAKIKSQFDHEYNAKFMKRLALLLCAVETTVDAQDNDMSYERYEGSNWGQFDAMGVAQSLVGFFKAYPIVSEMFESINILVDGGIAELSSGAFNYSRVCQGQGMNPSMANTEDSFVFGADSAIALSDESGNEVLLGRIGDLNFRRMGYQSSRENPRHRSRHHHHVSHSRHNPSYEEYEEEYEEDDSDDGYYEQLRARGIQASRENPSTNSERYQGRRGLYGRR